MTEHPSRAGGRTRRLDTSWRLEPTTSKSRRTSKPRASSATRRPTCASGTASSRPTTRTRSTQTAACEQREIERTAASLVDPSRCVARIDPRLQQSFYDTEFGEIIDRPRPRPPRIAEKPHLARPNAAPPPTDRPNRRSARRCHPRGEEDRATWASALRRRI